MTVRGDGDEDSDSLGVCEVFSRMLPFVAPLTSGARDNCSQGRKLPHTSLAMVMG